MAIRNLPVHRLLVAWQKEQSTYLSYLVTDLLGFLNQYISPDTWSHLLTWKLRAEHLQCQNHDTYKLVWLADGSIILSVKYSLLYLPVGQTGASQSRTDLIQLTNIPQFFTLTADPRRGFWYNTLREGRLFFCHYDPTSRQIIDETSMAADPRLLDFVIRPDGSLYLIYQAVTDTWRDLPENVSMIEHRAKNGELIQTSRQPTGTVRYVSETGLALDHGGYELTEVNLALDSVTRTRSVQHIDNKCEHLTRDKFDYYFCNSTGLIWLDQDRPVEIIDWLPFHHAWHFIRHTDGRFLFLQQSKDWKYVRIYELS